MSKLNHRIYIGILSSIVVVVLVYLVYTGFSYYSTALVERFYHPDYDKLKPSGTTGHGLGIIGSFLIIVGVTTYMVRKRSRRLARIGLLKHWLEFHIFLCALGPIMILFHTSLKFGGVVSISFWAMVAVFLSGVIGRFIYIQIPRTIEGRELSLSEVKGMKSNVKDMIDTSHSLDERTLLLIETSTDRGVEAISTNIFSRYLVKRKEDRQSLKKIKSALKANNLSKQEMKNILSLVQSEMSLNRRIDRLDTMKNLFKYWHVAHLPFAFIMLIIMIIHVIITLTFGYKWIF